MSKYIDVYETLCRDDAVAMDDPRRSAIISEMRDIQKAATDEDAAKVIEWWGAWPNPQHRTALEFVQEARRMMARRP